MLPDDFRRSIFVGVFVAVNSVTSTDSDLLLWQLAADN
jgi:hypothetical protein